MNFVDLEGRGYGLGSSKVSVMDGVKRSAENSDPHD
jgi:hypothetical protein